MDQQNLNEVTLGCLVDLTERERLEHIHGLRLVDVRERLLIAERVPETVLQHLAQHKLLAW